MRTDDMLVIGESVMDRVSTWDGRVTSHPGGSPANVAYGLGRLGRTVSFLTELGRDQDGAAVRAHLESADVDVQAATARRTPSATARVGQDGAARYEFDIHWQLPRAPIRTVGLHIHVGSIGAYLLPGADTVEGILAERRSQATVSLDPNIRPELLADQHAALCRTRRLLALSDVVKASDEDVAWLHPGLDHVSVARDWLEAGPSIVVITLGSRGSLAVTRAGVVEVPASPVQVKDTVGAGDAFMAALLDGLATADLLGDRRREALRAITTADLEPVLGRAARAAAITVGRSGAQPPTATELAAPAAEELLYARVRTSEDQRAAAIKSGTSTTSTIAPTLQPATEPQPRASTQVSPTS